MNPKNKIEQIYEMNGATETIRINVAASKGIPQKDSTYHEGKQHSTPACG